MALFYSLLGCLTSSIIGFLLCRKLKFDLGKGFYCGAFPVLGAFIGAFYKTGLFNSQKGIILLTGLVLLAVFGFLRDYKRISYKKFFALYAMLLIVFCTGLVSYKYITISSAIVGALWITFIIGCLKLSSLVYEMPQILISLTALMEFLYLINKKPELLSMIQGERGPVLPDDFSALLCVSLIISGFGIVFFGKGNHRLLQGTSGLCVSGFVISAITMAEQNALPLVGLGLCIPAMVVIFPPMLICFMILTSYFGNKLHVPGAEGSFQWTVKREKTVVFAGMIFLCLTLAGVIISTKTPFIALIADLLLLSLAVGSFVKMFIRLRPKSDEPQKKITLLNTTIDAVTPEETLEFIREKNKQHLFAHIITADSLALLRAAEEADFKSVMDKAELVVPDGAGIVWASDFEGQPLPGRVPGVALVDSICKDSAESGRKLYFIGGKPGVAQKAAEELEKKYKVNICGIMHGYFKRDSEEEKEVLENIVKAKPDVLFVALGVPAQEQFISKIREMNVNCVAIGVGGSFDVISGNIKRAPVIMQRCGIEWLYRLMLEPSRFSRMAKIPFFVMKILREKWNE